ncbi:MAG: DegT/DnrJ/EryC1/StrS family aminotransferase [Candidatus Omnitrophica bacterium]|nr:DegT/DnrJ/EryC1/StrS family aminotransferase [Candidatus Omnitrophota bacterium]
MPGPGAYWIGEEEKREVMDVLESGYPFRYGDLSDSKYKQKVYTFEREFAAYTEAKYCVATNSGTSTLLISLKAADIQHGDEVIVPTYGFIASYGAVIFLGGAPVLAEIDESLCMDPQDIEKRITPKTKAIMPVHVLGNPCDMDAILEIAQKKGLAVIEDCCQACGGTYRGKHVGNFGDFGGFSLNVFKTITSGDGGMLITNKDEYGEFAFGMTDQGYKRKEASVQIAPPSNLGFNFRMNELTGAFALAQLRKLPRIVSTLRRKKKLFKDAIADCPGVSFRTIHDPNGECATVLNVRFETRERAAQVAEKLKTVTVDHTGWHVYFNMDHLLRHLQSIGQPCSHADFPRTEDLLKRSINLSVGVVDPGLGTAFGININSTEEEIEAAAARFRQVCESTA